jgi:hypothetical protein
MQARGGRPDLKERIIAAQKTTVLDGNALG